MLKPIKIDEYRHIFAFLINTNTIKEQDMAILNCPCGYQGNPTHAKFCDRYKEEVARVTNNIKSYIRDRYNELCSITSCVEYVTKKEETVLSKPRLRILIDNELTAQGVQKGITNKKMQFAKQEKIKKTMLKKYGVENYGQLPEGGWGERNNIPYVELNIAKDYKQYRKEVNYYTKKQHEKLLRQQDVPTHCFYTEIEFIDNKQDVVNPNDPLKRTIDHRIPVAEAFVNGTLPEEVAAAENTVYCLRIVNSLKSNTDETHFVEKILPKFKEMIENESKIC